MNKLNVARTALECCLGGGCITGGVLSNKVINELEETKKNHSKDADKKAKEALKTAINDKSDLLENA